jgi:hypothetical protein
VRCAQCGHDDPRAFEIRTASGVTAWFDSFGCAIQRLAVACANCGTKVIGHGLSTEDGLIYCSTHCAGVDLKVGTGLIETSQPGPPDTPASPAELDAAAAESFPASDAPAYWAREGAPSD